MTRSDAATTFHALHQGGLLILPNAWDAGSARIIENGGAKAIATSSAAVAWANGYADGEALPIDRLLSTVRAIVRVVTVPVSGGCRRRICVRRRRSRRRRGTRRRRWRGGRERRGRHGHSRSTRRQDREHVASLRRWAPIFGSTRVWTSICAGSKKAMRPMRRPSIAHGYTARPAPTRSSCRAPPRKDWWLAWSGTCRCLLTCSRARSSGRTEVAGIGRAPFERGLGHRQARDEQRACDDSGLPGGRPLRVVRRG